MQETFEDSLDAVLRRKLSALDCIPEITYPHLLKHFRRQIEIVPGDSAEGLDVVLTLVGEVHSRITNTSYRRLCNELKSENSISRLKKRLQLELEADSPPWPWLETADYLVTTESHAPEALYCVLNSFFWTPPDPSRFWEEIIVRAIVIAEACCDLGSPRVAIDFLQSIFGKVDRNYSEKALAEWLDNTATRLRGESTVCIDYLHGCIASLIRALCESIRFDDAMVLFLQWLKYWEKNPRPGNIVDLDRVIESDFSKLNTNLHWHFVEAAANLLYLTGDDGTAKIINYLLKPLKTPSGALAQPFRLRQTFAIARVQCYTGTPDAALALLDSLLGVQRTNDAAHDAECRITRLRQIEENLGVDDALLFAGEISLCMLASADQEVSRCAPVVAFELLFPADKITRCREYLVNGGNATVIGWQLTKAKKASQIRAMSAVVNARKGMLLKTTSRSTSKPGVATRLRSLFQGESQGVTDNIRDEANANVEVTAVLFQAVCEDFYWLENDDGIDVTTKLKAIELWISVVCPTLKPFPISTFAKFIEWHRSTHLSVQDASPLDRENFVLGTSRLRSLILDATNAAYAGAVNEEDANRIRQFAIAWTSELQQRLAVERILIRSKTARHLKTGDSPSIDWPFRKPYPADNGPNSADVISSMAAYHEEPNGLSGEYERADESIQEQLTPQSEFDQLVWDGVSPSLVANAMHVDDVLLQLDFTRDGSPLVTAVRPQNGQLEVLHINKGSGQAGASSRVAVSAAIHDTLVRLLVSSPTEQASWRAAINIRNGRFATLRDQLGGTDIASQKEAARALAKSIKVLSGEHHILSDALYKVLTPTDSRSHERWEQFVANGALRVAEFLTDTFAPGGWLEWVGHKPVDSTSSTGHDLRVRDALNSATQRFLSDVAAEINFDGIAPEFLNPASTRLVIQANDEWQNVPIAFLPAANRRLFEHVRCTRNVFSLLLDRIAESIEGRAFQVGDNDNLLCISWFDETERNRCCLRWAMELHRRKTTLANRFNLNAYAAAQQPLGNVSTLAAACFERHYRVATVCGHGEMLGVNLAPDAMNNTTYWNGGGVDLSKVELVMMVSCSLGRIKRRNDLDSDGFFITQAINRGRSAIACRWPVLLDEAVPFATDISERFLAYRESYRLNEGWLRAAALNDARKALFSGHTASDVSQLSTGAAFELFGLG